jgi:hypothetical protein
MKKKKHVGLVQSKHHYHIMNVTCSDHGIQNVAE